MILVGWVCWVGGCASVPAGNPASGYAIHGFVGETSDSAAAGATVLLFDGVKLCWSEGC